MNLKNKFKNMNFLPTPSKKENISRDELNNLLHIPHKKRLCFHKWVYWHFNGSTKYHRVCKKCYKKQQDMNLLSAKQSPIWIKDRYF